MTFHAGTAAATAGFILICAIGSFAARPDSLKLAACRAAAVSVAGWTEQKDGFRSFGTKELYDLIDGGAVEYEKPGLVGGIVFELAAADNRSAKIYIDDFGTRARAQSLLKEKRKAASDPKPLAGARKADGFTDEVIGGCVAYASSESFYFELVLTGYDKPDRSKQDAKAFVETLVKIVK
jgi:hypothetical protein